MRSKVFLLRYLKISDNGLLQETEVLLCEMNSHITMKFLRKILLVFICGYLLCNHKLQCVQRYPIADFQKTVLAH